MKGSTHIAAADLKMIGQRSVELAQIDYTKKIFMDKVRSRVNWQKACEMVFFRGDVLR